MDAGRVVVYGVIGLVLVTTLVSGPLVGDVDFTTASEQTSVGEGNVTIDEISLPASATISEGRYGSGEYYLRVPDAAVEVVAVSGNPLLAYSLSIQEMDYSRTTTHFISSSNTGRYALSIERSSMEASMVKSEEYDGRLAVYLRANGTERQLATRNITVEVTG